MDYYQILGLSRSAEKNEIHKAYRVLALKNHPLKNPSDDALKTFSDLAEAYTVLIDDQLRAIYTQFGLRGLTEGVSAHDNFDGFPGGFKFTSDPDKVFEDFFGGKNPFADFFSTEYEPKAATMGSKSVEKEETSSGEPHVDVNVPVTLEEFYNGAVKVAQVTLKGKPQKVRLDIKAGWKDGTTVIQKITGEKVIFHLNQVPHKTFKREGNDLILDHKVPLLEALVGSSIEIQTLDDRTLRIPVYEVVAPGYFKYIKNEGMPLNQSPEKKGQLIIRFQIAFPTYFNEEQRSYLKMAFSK